MAICELIYEKDIKKLILFQNKKKLIEDIFLQVHMFINGFDFKIVLNFKNCQDHLRKNFDRFSFSMILPDFLDSLNDSITHSQNLQVRLNASSATT